MSSYSKVIEKETGEYKTPREKLTVPGKPYRVLRPTGKCTELLFDLGEMSWDYYLRNQQWREVFIAGPTRNAAGNTGNDFPGLFITIMLPDTSGW